MPFQTVKLKKRSGSQIIQLPDNLSIDDDKVYLKKVGNSLYVIPFQHPWDSLIESTSQFTDDYLEVREQPEQQKRDHFE
ncbi:MAG: AbrB/MazE/SpoVT family DNA-binding domain-containing protein [Candidatus Paceibacterota bacterium]